MTVRVYLQAVRLVAGDPQPGDIPAERLFVHASEPSEVWVETESKMTPAAGKAVTFALTTSLDLGINRVVGTVERRVSKITKQRLDG